MTTIDPKPTDVELRSLHFSQFRDGFLRVSELAEGAKPITVREERLKSQLLNGKMAGVSKTKLLETAETAYDRISRPIDIVIHEDRPPLKDKEYLSLLKSLHMVFREEFDLSYKEAVLLTQFLAERLLRDYLDYSTEDRKQPKSYADTKAKSGYRRLINYFFQMELGDLPQDTAAIKRSMQAEAESLWNAYLDLTTVDQVDAYPRSYRPDVDETEPLPNKITVNSAIWSFEYNRALPIHRHFYNFSSEDEGPHGDIRKRRDSFFALRKAQKYFSTAEELVKSGLNHAFYFDKTEDAYGKMTIYQLGLDSGEVAKTTIDGQHRLQMEPEGIFSFEELEDYITQRKGNTKDKAEELRYQNQVLRWYIRSGLLDPKKVSRRDRPSDINLLENLPENKQELLAIYDKQFRQNKDRNGDFSTEEDDALDRMIDFLFDKSPEDLAARLFVFDTGFFDLTQRDNSINLIYWVPLVTGHPEQPIGGVFYLNCSETLHDPEDLQSLRSTLFNLATFFSGLYGNKQMQEITHRHDRQRNTAGAVAIISRNISHNVGSHVMSYQKYMLNDPRLILANRVLGDLVQRHSSGVYHIDPRYVEAAEGMYTLDYDRRQFKLPYLTAKGHFDGYLQGRHDYIGAVASDTTFYYGAVNLREEVLEYFLNAELEPMTSKPGVYETNYQYQNNPHKRCILLERIAWSENFQRGDIHLTYDESAVPDANLSLPAGIVGRQALFSILENIIRNTAKHGARREEGRDLIRLHIRITTEEMDDFYQITISDNSGSRAKQNLSRIKDSLSKPLIRQDGSGQIDESQKGIKEMQISAAWMRGITPRDINDAGEKKALQIDYDGNGLQYTIYVRKAKKILLIGTDLDYQETLPSSWSYADARQLMNQTVEQQYDLALLDTALDKSIRTSTKLMERLPVRYLDFDLSRLKDQDLTDDRMCDEWERKIRVQWLQGEKMQGLVKIPFDDLSIGLLDKEQDEDQTRGRDCKVGIEKDTEVETASKYHIVFRQHNDSAGIFREFAYLNSGGGATSQQEHDQFLALPYVEGISGNNTTARLLRDMPKDWWWCQRVKESAMTKVMLIDERTWKEITDPRDDRNESFNADIHYEYWKYTKKNIHIYTILPSKDNPNKMALVNLRNETEAIIDDEGFLSWTKSSTAQQFHFISFHQGLLDKLPSGGTERLDFFSNFRRSLEPSLRYYMHSGRSFNPDLPKNVGFIPLSSLDAALRDCKFVLTELLFAGIINPENR